MKGYDNGYCFNNQEIINIIVGFIKNGFMIDDPDIVGVDSKEEYVKSDMGEEKDYYEYMAVAYLENMMNEVSNTYTENELSYYLCGYFNGLNNK